MNKLIIGGREFSSRLFVGTGKFSSNELMEKAIEASGTEMITVAHETYQHDPRSHRRYVDTHRPQ